MNVIVITGYTVVVSDTLIAQNVALKLDSYGEMARDSHEECSVCKTNEGESAS